MFDKENFKLLNWPTAIILYVIKESESGLTWHLLSDYYTPGVLGVLHISVNRQVTLVLGMLVLGDTTSAHRK